jgi:putative transposase
MPRPLRDDTAGTIYHVLNRSAHNVTLFHTPSDYRSFLSLMIEAQKRIPIRLHAYCLMPNHWHLLLSPVHDKAMGKFIKQLCSQHSQRWLKFHGASRSGAIYEARYKSIPVTTNRYLFTVWRYIERNPLEAELAPRAELWPWSSLAQRENKLRHSVPELVLPAKSLPCNWLESVNKPEPSGQD